MIIPGCASSIVCSCACRTGAPSSLPILFCNAAFDLGMTSLSLPPWHSFADLNIHPSPPASSCTPSAPLYTDFLFLLADCLGFEDPPPGFPVAERTRRRLEMFASTACFLRRMCPTLSPATRSQPSAHACSTPCTSYTATTLDSMDGLPGSVTSVLLGFPVV
jgi:hypothetical protein